jgi:hypothetical protein
MVADPLLRRLMAIVAQEFSRLEPKLFFVSFRQGVQMKP